ncbi:MAG: Rne/Rng family ribonuclease [Tindallia sp. MSAO_Bac2]|nr:MAG: Rne/Rng family ribonuclease [Tindallia sp. MSAO_Bac2]
MKQIIADVGVFETRAAVLDNGIVEELHFERKNNRSLVNNIYCGSIVNIVRGLGTVFIDIGTHKNVFLHESEINKPLTMLKEGDRILVQITKDALGSKGAKATTFLSLPGKYIVFLPNDNHIGISNRITDATERSKLEEIANRLTEGTSHGIIMRTESLNQPGELIESDFQYMQMIWNQIDAGWRTADKGELLFREEALLPRLLRDVMDRKTAVFILNDSKEASKIRDLCQRVMPDYCSRITESDQGENLFEEYDIEMQWKHAMKNKIPLKSGGSVIFNHTEALTTIDVNTGKFTGKKAFEETVLQINLEAVDTITRQLRLRDIGGIIIIDFIDMKSFRHNSMLLNKLKQELNKDRQKTVVLGMTKLGLVEMTRRKTRKKVESLFNEPCPNCDGTGWVPSIYRHVYELENKFRKLETHRDIDRVVVSINPERWTELKDEGISLEELAEAYGLEIELIKDASITRDNFDIKLHLKRNRPVK